MSTSVTIEEPIWFGSDDRPLVGWLARPSEASTTKGGVVLAAPIGREARSARRAIRALAVSLAAEGFLALRFDYDGTGDSAGDFADPERDRAWTESARHAVELLRLLGTDDVSAVGMRLGATIVGEAAVRYDLNLTSLVLWDPCENGKNYLRELGALEALRRDDVAFDADAPIETSEFVFPKATADEVRRLNLAKLASGTLAERVLVITRDDRFVSDRFRARLNEEKVEWRETAEMRALSDVVPHEAVLPALTMTGIISWLTGAGSTGEYIERPARASALIAVDSTHVRERFVKLGSRQLFGIVTEPVAEPRGPLIVMLNVANEEHTGPARQWVDLARRWATFGLRSLRFDLTGLGDSPSLPGQSDYPLFELMWHSDVTEAITALNPDDPSDAVLIGLCSGAYLAVEGALRLGAKGVCALNPPVGTDLLHSISIIESSRFAPLRTLAKAMKFPVVRTRWTAMGVWQIVRTFLPRKYSRDLMASAVSAGTNLFVLATVQDMPPYPKVPYLRSIDQRRIARPRNYVAQFVPDFDHSMHVAIGRARAVALLDRHVLEVLAGIPLVETSEIPNMEEL